MKSRVVNICEFEHKRKMYIEQLEYLLKKPITHERIFLTYLWKEFTDLKRLCPGKAKMVGGVMNFHPC